MKKFSDFLQNKVVPVTNKFAQLPFMVVLRNSVMTIIPLMIVGAIGTFMTNIPFEAAAEFVKPTNAFFTALSGVSANISGLVVAIAVGYFGAQHYKLDSIFGIITSLAAYFAATLNAEFAIDPSAFGANGMFTAILIGFASVYIQYLCKKYKIEIRMPSGVPPMVAASFSAILSLVISTSLVLLLRIGAGLNINELITLAVAPLTTGLSSLPGLVLFSIMMTILFICGINPSVIAGFLIAVMAANSEANAIALAAGQQTEEFVTWGMYTIMCSGGTGATIGLMILMLRSKAETHRTLGKISLLPVTFNINEPIIYGFPIMFNPIMLVPFILVPVINIVSTWLLMSANIIGRPMIEIPWTTPPIVNGFLMTGGDWRTAIWTGIIVIISMVVYYPFFKIAEKQELEIENQSKA